MMHRWKKRSSAKCPRCDSEEDKTHVWKCRGSGADEIWMKSMAKLRRELTEAHTLPNLVDIICDRLTAWRYDSNPTVPISNFLGLRKLIDDQDKVGWQALLEGMPVAGWAEVQQNYLAWRKMRRTGKRWLSSVIKKMWDVAWDLWDHRNGVLHDSDDNVASQLQRKAIEEEFTLGPTTVMMEARQLFRPGIHRLIALPPAAQQAWLIRIRNSRIRYAELGAVHNTFRDERRGMARWLQIPDFQSQVQLPTGRSDTRRIRPSS
jgi:hypothetical protein